MGIKVSKSIDNAGIMGPPQSGIASSTTAPALNQGGALRDLLINYNAEVLFNRNRTFENTVFAIDTNFDIKNTEPVTYYVNGLAYALADNTSFNTGTAATITADLWGIVILTHNGTTATVTWATTSAAMGYATEAAAKAALGTITSLCPASGFSSLGYVTVQAGASLWTAGTDALQGGTGGTPSADTNYYDDPSLNGTFGGYQIGNGAGTVITQ